MPNLPKFRKKTKTLNSNSLDWIFQETAAAAHKGVILEPARRAIAEAMEIVDRQCEDIPLMVWLSFKSLNFEGSVRDGPCDP